MSCCDTVIKISSVSVSTAGIMTLTTTMAVNLVNGGKYLLVLPVDLIPTSTIVNNVEIGIDGSGYKIQDRCFGNYVNTDQIRFINTSCKGNKVLRLVYGGNPEHFKIISQSLPQSQAV